jgi:hypothetical protein
MRSVVAALLCLSGGAGCAFVGGIDGDEYAIETSSSSGNPGDGPVVFVTASHYLADFGILVGADLICRTAAESAPSIIRGKQWRAWISNQLESASEHIDCYPGRGPFRRTDGKVVATDCEALVSEMLQQPILLTETGDEGTGTVWTGTAQDGCWSGVDCDGWSGTGDGTYGQPGAQDAFWTNGGDAPCAGSTMALYCFEAP